MTRKWITEALKRLDYGLLSSPFLLFCNFIFHFPFFHPTEKAMGPIWFGFSMNYHGSDPVSAVKAPKMSQLYPYPPNEYSTTCSHLPIVSSFVLVSNSTGNSALGGRRGKGKWH